MASRTIILTDSSRPSLHLSVDTTLHARLLCKRTRLKTHDGQLEPRAVLRCSRSTPSRAPSTALFYLLPSRLRIPTRHTQTSRRLSAEGPSDPARRPTTHRASAFARIWKARARNWPHWPQRQARGLRRLRRDGEQSSRSRRVKCPV